MRLSRLLQPTRTPADQQSSQQGFFHMREPLLQLALRYLHSARIDLQKHTLRRLQLCSHAVPRISSNSCLDTLSSISREPLSNRSAVSARTSTTSRPARI